MEFKFSEIQKKALSAIVAYCDYIDGWGFTTPSEAFIAVSEELDNAEDILKQLDSMEAIEIDTFDDTLWVRPEVYDQFC